jgi:hypothetical protein
MRRPFLIGSFQRRLGIPWPVLIFSLAVPLVLLGAIDLAYLDLEPGERFTGYFRQDFIYYSANAREVFENGNGLTYGYPFSASFTSPRVYSHLQLLLLGWAWKLSGVPLPILWQIAGVVFGVCMFIALYKLLACYFEEEHLGYVFYTISLAGGFLGYQALWVYLFGTAPGGGGMELGYFEVYRRVMEDTYGVGWFTNMFQSALITTEVYYHALAFATFALAVTGRFRWALLGVFLTWWSHPFTGTEVGAIVGAWAALEVLLARERRMIAFAAGVLAISLVFLSYYVVLLPHWSREAADILGRWRTAPYVLRWPDIPGMWGVFPIGLAFLLWKRIRPLAVQSSSRDRFLAVWIVVVAGFLLHDKVLPDSVQPFQPMHFSHGYMFLPLAILTLRGSIRLTRGWPRPRLRAAAAAFLVLVSVDNVLFTASVATFSERPVLKWDEVAVADYLAQARPAGVVLVLGQVPLLREYLSVVTPHRVYLISGYYTSYFGRKVLAVRDMVKSGSPASAGAALGIQWVVHPKERGMRMKSDLEAGKVRIAFERGRLRVLEILVPPVPWTFDGATRAYRVP